jgi:uncharacterized protein (TIGR03437 family)
LDVVVQTAIGSSPPLRVQVDAYAPGIFFDATTGFGAILIAGTSSTTQVRPARPGDYVEIYCTGLGTSGGRVAVKIADIDARVVYSGQTAIPGLYQVDVQIPDSTSIGELPLTLSINGVVSNTVKVRVAARP